jgi:hypothetical protein
MTWMRYGLVVVFALAGIWQVAPLLDWVVVEDRYRGEVVACFSEPVPGRSDVRYLEVLYEYRVETPEAIRILLGRRLTDRSGRSLVGQLPSEVALALEQRVQDLGGPEALACVVSDADDGPIAYCPQLSGEGLRWPLGLTCLALASLGLVLPEWRRVLRKRA